MIYELIRILMLSGIVVRFSRVQQSLALGSLVYCFAIAWHIDLSFQRFLGIMENSRSRGVVPLIVWDRCVLQTVVDVQNSVAKRPFRG